MRVMKWLGIVILLALCAAGGAAAWYVRALVPQVEGSLALQGLSAPVAIVRDGEGVPHIEAQSERDAHFALGFVHAQDRLWQMEINRRIANGRMAEALGANALEIDRFLRTIGIRRSALAILEKLDPETREALEAYAAGVNAYLAQRPVLPLEFLITGTPRPQPWEPADSIGWLLMMAWDLGGNWTTELHRMQLAQRGWPRAKIDALLTNYRGAPYPDNTEYRELYREVMASPPVRMSALPLAPLEGLGSNNWVLDGTRTTSGKPLLANDPHLGITAPALWYFAHLKAPGLDVIGATLPGLPTVVLGRTDGVAWGFTNTNPDVQDLYIERIDPADPTRYQTPDGWARFEVVEERIKVKDAPDVVLNVRISRHGPIISDGAVEAAATLLKPGYAMAFSWTALAPDNASAAAVIRMNRAKSAEAFVAAARLFSAPQQNMVYADTAGRTGFIAPGTVPVRGGGHATMGLAPGLGWEARFDWQGFIPPEALPQETAFAKGYRATANEKVVGEDYAPFLTFGWAPPYRAERIRQRIEAQEKHDLASMASIQADTVSLAMKEFLSLVTGTPGTTEEERAVLQALRAFDGDMRADRAEPLIAAAWQRELTRLVYGDDLADLFRPLWSPRPDFMRMVLTNENGAGAWCDDIRTPAAETCEGQAARALTAALADLKSRYGEDRAAWRWGSAHAAKAEHRPFSRVPPLDRLFEIIRPMGGDTYTVNVGTYTLRNERLPFTVGSAASLRAIYDLADPEKSVFIHSSGQSGNPLSGGYGAYADRWAAVRYIPMQTRPEAYRAGAMGTLMLRP